MLSNRRFGRDPSSFRVIFISLLAIASTGPVSKALLSSGKPRFNSEDRAGSVNADVAPRSPCGAITTG